MCFFSFLHFSRAKFISVAVCSAFFFPRFQPTVKVTAPPMWPMLCIRQQLVVIYQPGRKPQATKAAAQPGAETKKKIRGTTWAPLKPPAHQSLLQIQFCNSLDCTLFWLVIYFCVCLWWPCRYSTGRPKAFKALLGVYFAVLLSVWLWGLNDRVQLPQ